MKLCMIMMVVVFLVTCQSDEPDESLDLTAFMEKFPSAVCSYYQECGVEIEYTECVNELQENIASTAIELNEEILTEIDAIHLSYPNPTT